MSTYILTLDIGGTNPSIAMMEMLSETQFRKQINRFIPNKEGALIPAMISFIEDCKKINVTTHVCCICVAGPVSKDNKRCDKPTNAKFSIDADKIKECIPSLKEIFVINDFAAIAYAVSIIDPSPSNELIKQLPHYNEHGGEYYLTTKHGPRAVIGPGTGTGVAYIAYHGNDAVIIDSEGGHGGMPFNLKFNEIMTFVAKKLNRNTFGMEAFASGQGIRHIADFFLNKPGAFDDFVKEYPQYLQEYNKYIERVKAPKISDNVLQSLKDVDGQIYSDEKNFVMIDFAKIVGCSIAQNPKSHVAMQIFMELLGTAVQSIALQNKPTGGLFLAGGILPKSMPILLQGDFMKSFQDGWKENINNLVLNDVPVYVIMDYEISYTGCARAAVVHGLLLENNQYQNNFQQLNKAA